MAALGGGYFSGTPFIRRHREPCSIADVLGYFPPISRQHRMTGAGSLKNSLLFVGTNGRRFGANAPARFGCYFIRDAEKTECRAKRKGQTLQCLVNVCQFFSHVICGYGTLANASKCSASDIHSCLRQTLLKGKVFFSGFFFF